MTYCSIRIGRIEISFAWAELYPHPHQAYGLYLSFACREGRPLFAYHCRPRKSKSEAAR